MRDQMKDRKPDGKFWIVNLDLNSGPGTHWVCVLDFLRVPIYIDPYGLSPPPEVRAFMRKSKHGKYAVYSRIQYQKLHSIQCGQFVVEFITEALEKRHNGDLEAYDDDLVPYPSDFNEGVVGMVKL